MKKKKDEKYRKRRMQYIPTDLIIEILTRLPEKSVARFSCVSKLWSSITSDPSFPRPHLLLCFQKDDDDLFVSSIPQINSNWPYSSSLSFHHHKTKLPVDFLHCISTESVHGLICFELKKPIVWNPSTRKFIRLPAIPEPCKDWKRSTLLLGYDPIQGKHKVVCVPYKRTCYVCRVFTLGSSSSSHHQESWRTVKCNRKHRPASDAYGRCIEGVIYYLANFGQVVMSFHVRSEKFDMITLPSEYCRDLMTYKGRLACFDDWDYGKFWILEDAQKHSWSGQDFLSPSADFGRSFKLTGFTHAGEFIYVPKRDTQSFYILLLCDPVRNSWRRFEFKISVEHPTYALLTFPNHIDSQMSL